MAFDGTTVSSDGAASPSIRIPAVNCSDPVLTNSDLQPVAASGATSISTWSSPGPTTAGVPTSMSGPRPTIVVGPKCVNWPVTVTSVWTPRAAWNGCTDVRVAGVSDTTNAAVTTSKAPPSSGVV